MYNTNNEGKEDKKKKKISMKTVGSSLIIKEDKKTKRQTDK